MLFDADGPDIPISLLRAQRAGNLLLIVGAGVSRAAGLPLFGELADQVYIRLGQALPGSPGSLASQAEIEAYNSGQYDRLIGLLEQRLVLRRTDWHQPHNIVRDAVTALVEPKARANIDAHADLLDLSRAADGKPRLVTTNFDTLFERAWHRRTKQDVASSAGAGMPAVGSHDFTGVMHLHGRVADPRYRLSATDLVLTSANFGEAYMRSGWASRFVYDLLRRYTLLLIGYSADDPPMRYMLEATEEGRLNFPDLKPAYALAGDTADNAGALREAWRGKGVLPLVYPAPNHDHSPLYNTLSAWAGLARNPLQWSQDRLTQLSKSIRDEATTDQRTSFAYLTKEVSSVGISAQSARDAAWVEEILPVDFSDAYTLIAWFRDRLEVAATARYAVTADATLKPHIARAVDALLSSRRQPLADLYMKFWVLYVQAHLQPALHSSNRIRSSSGVTSRQVQEVVARLEPRLKVERRFNWPDFDDSVGEPVTIHDLAHFILEAADRNWRRQLDSWPAEAEAEERLLFALDRSLCEVLELGFDAGLVDVDGDLRSFDLALVHAPEADEGLLDPNDRHKSSWRLNQPDANNQRFAPMIRTMTALWRRLASRDLHKASHIATIWAERKALIFKRMAAWTAIEGDEGSAVRIERYLRNTSRSRYWSTDNSPELVRFYCKRWNKLSPATRRSLEQAIVAGMLPQIIQRMSKSGDRNYARALYTTRELARIRTAGGRLSQKTLGRLNAMYRKFPNLPREMPMLAHLYNPSWSGSGYSADIRVLDEVDDDQLLRSAEAFEESNRIEQGDLWTVFAKSEPLRAYAALKDANEKGEFSAYRWQPFLGLYAYDEPELDEAERPPLEAVLDTMETAPADGLAMVAHQLARIIERNFADSASTLFPKLMKLWDHLVDALAAEEIGTDDSLAELALSHPLGMVADSLVTVLNGMRPPAGEGFPDILAGQFEKLVQIQGRAGLVVRAALLQQLAFLRAIAPQWVDAMLMPGIFLEDDNAIDLMSVVARSVAPQYAELFNKLKPAIFRALEHDRTDDGVREELCGALIGAAFAVIEGRGGFELTGVECRRILTRVSNKALARMAWELTSLLRDKLGAEERGQYWDQAIAPFLLDYWPNDVSARTIEVSENLAHLPALAGASFERAVAIVLDLICPIQRYEIRFGLGLSSDGDDLIALYPRAALTLISGILDRASPPPSDLAEVINSLLATDGQIASEPAFWRIRQMLRPD